MELNVLVKTATYIAFTRPWTPDTTVIIQLLGDHVTDAVPGRFPAEPRTSYRVNEDGTVNYYEEADANDISRWKRRLGEFVVKTIVIPEYRKQGRE